MAKRAKPSRGVGRPPAGARSGERVKDYPQLSVRMPPDALSSLTALSAVFREPQWRILHRAIQGIIKDLSVNDRELFDALVQRRRGR
jgi:hypothetical protein